MSTYKINSNFRWHVTCVGVQHLFSLFRKSLTGNLYIFATLSLHFRHVTKSSFHIILSQYASHPLTFDFSSSSNAKSPLTVSSQFGLSYYFFFLCRYCEFGCYHFFSSWRTKFSFWNILKLCLTFPNNIFGKLQCVFFKRIKLT